MTRDDYITKDDVKSARNKAKVTKIEAKSRLVESRNDNRAKRKDIRTEKRKAQRELTALNRHNRIVFKDKVSRLRRQDRKDLRTKEGRGYNLATLGITRATDPETIKAITNAASAAQGGGAQAAAAAQFLQSQARK